jgi:hypothetical protein
LDRKHCKKLVEFGARAWRKELAELSLDSPREAVELAEQVADGARVRDALQVASDAAFALSQAAGDYAACYVESWGRFDSKLMAAGDAAEGAHYASLPSANVDVAALSLSRAIAYLKSKRFGEANQDGDPDEQAAQCELLRDIFGTPFRKHSRVKKAWLTDTVLSLARQMYESRDFSAMPILADALQDAGCENADILEHCRGLGPHVRGCWVVDLILEKE